MRGIKWRVGVVLVLFTLPWLLLSGVGAYSLWEKGWMAVAWWPLAGCFLAAYLLAWYWTRRRGLSISPREAQPDVPSYWTERDREAWNLVTKFAQNAPPISPEQIGDLNRYAQDAQQLALQVTQVYRPTATDPFGHLTIPELLTCSELIAHDLAKLVETYVPGSHALTINNIKAVRTAADWYERGRNVYWAASLLIDPVRAGLQILATKAGLQTSFQLVQKNLIAWFFTAYLHELGRYLIELNSGRLKIGAKRYQELMAAHAAPPNSGSANQADIAMSAPSGSIPAVEPGRVCVAIIGPVKAGKSSLINALLGEQRAAVSQVPLTATATRYDLNQEGMPSLALIDTAGFGHERASEAEILAAVEAAKAADVVVLAIPARSAARAAEVDALARIRAEFQKHPDLRQPTVVVALTQIDLLTPAMEWQPPYNWATGERLKEVSIREAKAAAQEVLAGLVSEIVPVCAAQGKEFGVRSDLLAAISSQLDEARGVGLLRTLHAEANLDKTMKVIGQAVNVGRELFKTLWKK